ncbi:hypothetical protein DICVIV_11159 [Dictyocaulus viviparus]|uniref:Uncharacterized protein n=1 Tax=Dictyocaulus viviparus TaxID=29172 RepID=A0A0D8XGH2_DICVI|nr:hypothetical protein DICVIV_11159 [Dictyocaulus viviparus]
MNGWAMMKPDECVDERFDMKSFADKYIGANGQPSHKRYIMYFSSLLSGRIRVNPAPIYLRRITVSRLAGRVLSFKIYERLQPNFLIDSGAELLGNVDRIDGRVVYGAFELSSDNE